jgi:hypothetical protein
MPPAVIVVFLLFFAILAFAWFYLQRAKARTAGPDQTVETQTAAAEHDDHSH